ncbi:MAG: hypothetical protein ACI4NG_04995 [Candidatus Gallimonas sp.]
MILATLRSAIDRETSFDTVRREENQKDDVFPMRHIAEQNPPYFNRQNATKGREKALPGKKAAVFQSSYLNKGSGKNSPGQEKTRRPAGSFVTSKSFAAFRKVRN